MTTAKKIPTKLGSMAGIKVILVADFTAATTNLLSHPARPTVDASQFCTETARVQQQSDAQWLAEYDAADSLVQPPVSVIIRAKPKGPVIENTFATRSNRPDSAVSSCPKPVRFWGRWAIP